MPKKKKAKPAGDSRHASGSGSANRRAKPKGASAAGDGRAAADSGASDSEEIRTQELQYLQEMFAGKLDPVVVHMIMNDCEFKVEAALETLFQLVEQTSLTESQLFRLSGFKDVYIPSLEEEEEEEEEDEEDFEEEDLEIDAADGKRTPPSQDRLRTKEHASQSQDELDRHLSLRDNTDMETSNKKPASKMEDGSLQPYLRSDAVFKEIQDSKENFDIDNKRMVESIDKRFGERFPASRQGPFWPGSSDTQSFPLNDLNKNEASDFDANSGDQRGGKKRLSDTENKSQLDTKIWRSFPQNEFHMIDDVVSANEVDLESCTLQMHAESQRKEDRTRERQRTTEVASGQKVNTEQTVSKEAKVRPQAVSESGKQTFERKKEPSKEAVTKEEPLKDSGSSPLNLPASDLENILGEIANEELISDDKITAVSSDSSILSGVEKTQNETNKVSDSCVGLKTAPKSGFQVSQIFCNRSIMDKEPFNMLEMTDSQAEQQKSSLNIAAPAFVPRIFARSPSPQARQPFVPMHAFQTRPAHWTPRIPNPAGRGYLVQRPKFSDAQAGNPFFHPSSTLQAQRLNVPRGAGTQERGIPQTAQRLPQPVRYIPQSEGAFYAHPNMNRQMPSRPQNQMPHRPPSIPRQGFRPFSPPLMSSVLIRPPKRTPPPEGASTQEGALHNAHLPTNSPHEGARQSEELPQGLPQRPIPKLRNRALRPQAVNASQAKYLDRVVPLPEGKVLCLMRGCPGSGKSTLARHLVGNGKILSTDSYFMDYDGHYCFDVTKLQDAHEWCHQKAKEAMESEITPLIIDNTNVERWTMKPFVAMALQYGYAVEFREPTTPWKFQLGKLRKYNTHDVPRERIRLMLERYETNVSVENVLASSKPAKKQKKIPEEGKQPSFGKNAKKAKTKHKVDHKERKPDAHDDVCKISAKPEDSGVRDEESNIKASRAELEESSVAVTINDKKEENQRGDEIFVSEDEEDSDNLVDSKAYSLAKEGSPRNDENDASDTSWETVSDQEVKNDEEKMVDLKMETSSEPIADGGENSLERVNTVRGGNGASTKDYPPQVGVNSEVSHGQAKEQTSGKDQKGLSFDQIGNTDAWDDESEFHAAMDAVPETSGDSQDQDPMLPEDQQEEPWTNSLGDDDFEAVVSSLLQVPYQSGIHSRGLKEVPPLEMQKAVAEDKKGFTEKGSAKLVVEPSFEKTIQQQEALEKANQQEETSEVGPPSVKQNQESPESCKDDAHLEESSLQPVLSVSGEISPESQINLSIAEDFLREDGAWSSTSVEGASENIPIVIQAQEPQCELRQNGVNSSHVDAFPTVMESVNIVSLSAAEDTETKQQMSVSQTEEVELEERIPQEELERISDQVQEDDDDVTSVRENLNPTSGTVMNDAFVSENEPSTSCHDKSLPNIEQSHEDEMVKTEKETLGFGKEQDCDLKKNIEDSNPEHLDQVEQMVVEIGKKEGRLLTPTSDMDSNVLVSLNQSQGTSEGENIATKQLSDSPGSSREDECNVSVLIATTSQLDSPLSVTTLSRSLTSSPISIYSSFDKSSSTSAKQHKERRNFSRSRSLKSAKMAAVFPTLSPKSAEWATLADPLVLETVERPSTSPDIERILSSEKETETLPSDFACLQRLESGVLTEADVQQQGLRVMLCKGRQTSTPSKKEEVSQNFSLKESDNRSVIPKIVKLDKSTMTTQDGLNENIDDNLQNLVTLFPIVSLTDLKDMLTRCAGDVEWATNILLDDANISKHEDLEMQANLLTRVEEPEPSPRTRKTESEKQKLQKDGERLSTIVAVKETVESKQVSHAGNLATSMKSVVDDILKSISGSYENIELSVGSENHIDQGRDTSISQANNSSQEAEEQAASCQNIFEVASFKSWKEIEQSLQQEFDNAEINLGENITVKDLKAQPSDELFGNVQLQASSPLDKQITGSTDSQILLRETECNTKSSEIPEGPTKEANFGMDNYATVDLIGYHSPSSSALSDVRPEITWKDLPENLPAYQSFREMPRPEPVEEQVVRPKIPSRTSSRQSPANITKSKKYEDADLFQKMTQVWDVGPPLGKDDLAGKGVQFSWNDQKEVEDFGVPRPEQMMTQREENAQGREKLATREEHGDANIQDKPVRRKHKELRTLKEGLMLQLPTAFALQLQEMFGSFGFHLLPDGLPVEDLQVHVDYDLAKQLHTLWGQTLSTRFEQEEELENIIKADEEFARQLQQEEDISHMTRVQSTRSARYQSPKASPNRSQPPVSLQRGYGDSQGMMGVSASPKRPAVAEETKGLREIMEEELAAQLSQDMMVEEKLNSEESVSIATKLKRDKLYSEFPTLDRNALEDIFRANSYQLDPTIKQVNSFFDTASGPPKAVYSDEALDRIERELVEMTERESLASSSEGTDDSTPMEAHYQSIDNPDYQDYRAEATLHYRQRHEAFQKAAAAYNRGQKQLASFYSQQGHLHTEKLKEADKRASEAILTSKNSLFSDNTLDLHGLHVDEAILILNQVLNDKKAELAAHDGQPHPPVSKSPPRHVFIITGKGTHSRGGVARIRPAVTDQLKREGYRFSMQNAGLIKVNL